MKRPIRSVLAALTLFLLPSCTNTRGEGWIELTPEPAGTGPTRQLTGTVRYLAVEGGLFVIRDAAGTQFNPTNLPEAFRVEGMAVETEARRRDDMASIGMVGPLVELLRIKQGSGVTPSRSALLGSSWRLQEVAGTAVSDSIPATLEFSAEGAVSGNASCNRFSGSGTVGDGTLSFGPLATTRKMCADAPMTQESGYLPALGTAARWEIRGAPATLYIYGANAQAPLRFTQ